jgi:ferredoxin
MQVIIDQDRRLSSGQCVDSAPEVFDQREEDGVVVLVTGEPSDADVDDVRHAALVCPGRAISIQE